MNRDALKALLRPALENCASLGRQAYGDYADKLVDSLADSIVEMHETEPAQRATNSQLCRCHDCHDLHEWSDRKESVTTTTCPRCTCPMYSTVDDSAQRANPRPSVTILREVLQQVRDEDLTVEEGQRVLDRRLGIPRGPCGMAYHPSDCACGGSQ